jgi:capsular polysaccharide transport system ATP-binding protein
MIEVIDVCKDYHTRSGTNRVLSNVNFRVSPGEKVGIIGKNGAGKSTFVRLLAGAELPTSGRIVQGMTTSWPLAFTGGFQGAMTGTDNLRFICRIYNVPFEEKIDMVEDFAELGAYMREPIRTYSSGMRARLAFAISMAIDFDCFLVDEVVAVGDARFQAKCEEELFVKRRNRAMIIVSHSGAFVRQHCTRLSVFDNGQLINFDDLDHAFVHYHEIMMRGPKLA